MTKDLSRLFHHNPPREEGLRRELFVDREGELELLREVVSAESPLPLIQAIHGDSRIGKSHLAFRYLVDLEEEAWSRFEVHANEGLKARLVLQDLYQDVVTALNNVETFNTLDPEGVSSEGIWKEALEEARDLQPLVCDTIDSRKMLWSTSRKETWGGKLILSVFQLSDAIESGEAETVEVTLSQMTERQIVELIGRFLEILGMTTGRRSIVYVDDLDLLERESAAEREQVTYLKRLLVHLAEFDKVVVAATLRTRQLTHLQKGLFDALEVKRLGANLTREIHDRHIELFNDGKPIFDDDCLKALIEDADGLIGRFLRNCRKLVMWARQQGRSAGRLLGRHDLEDYVLTELQRLGGRNGYADYVDRIMEAVRDGRSEVVLDSSVLETELVFFVLDEPSDLALTMYPISSLAAQVIRKLSDEEETPETA